MPMPMRGLCSFLVRSGRNLIREPATITRSAGVELTLSGRLDAASAIKDAAFAGSSSSTTKAWINNTPATRTLPGFAGVSSVLGNGNAVATRSLHTSASAVGNVGLSWIPKAAYLTPLSSIGVKSLRLSFPANARSYYTDMASAVGNVGLSWIPKAAYLTPLSSIGVKSLRLSFPANARSYYTDMSGAPPRSGIRILLSLCGTYIGVTIVVAHLRKQDPSKPGIDWVVLGATPPVVPADYLEGCGCCWAIVSVQNIEAVLKIVTGKDTRLSLQEIIDCCGKEYGCKGGSRFLAFEYIKKNGLSSHFSYPTNLSEREGPCKAAGKPRAVLLLDFEEIPGADTYDYGKTTAISVEDGFKLALLKSPISVGFQSNEFFQDYTGYAIIEYDQCPPPPPNEKVNHALLLVGFGTDYLGNDFWLVQNVYGRRWGRNGFGRIRRGDPDPRGVGGITSQSAYRPIMKMEN